MNNLLKICFVSTLLFGIICFSGCGDNNSDYEISKMPDNFVRILKYKGADTTIIIPESFKGRKVLEISVGAFKNNTNLVSVVIPNTVRSISFEAFKGCTNLKSVTFPNQLWSIEQEAFADCISLTSINLPDSVKQIENTAFVGCSALKQVVINPNTNVSTSAFYDCDSLRYPTGSTVLDWYYFSEKYRMNRMNEKLSLNSLIDLFREGYYPFYESLCGNNDLKTYTQARKETISKHNEGIILGANTLKFRADDIKPTYNGLPPKYANDLGSKSNGKILIVQYWPQSFEINFHEMACLPEKFVPFYFSEVQYIVYITHKPANTIYYTNGGTITETKVLVDVYKFNTSSNSFTLLKNIGSINSKEAPIQTYTTHIDMEVNYGDIANTVNDAIEYIKMLPEK